MKINSKNINVFLDVLDEQFPNAYCELKYNKDYELAIAVMLSAQTTDAKVNVVTEKLFSLYPDLDKLSKASYDSIELLIRPLGLSKVKAKNVIGIAKELIENYKGILPSDKTELQKLPGIGNKSAGVIRAEVFKIADLPVDTHILRVSNRLKIAKKNDTPLDVENKLKKLIPESRWIKSHHQIIHFGRYFCTAKKPQCENCKLRAYCDEIK